MILFQNVYITDTHAKGVAAFQDRQMAKSFDKLDIYKYCLASISKIYPWKKVIINTKLDENYKHRQEELNVWIQQEFGEYDLVIRNDRNETQEQWQQDYESLDDNLIWFSGNHDHAFIDNDYSYFKNFVNSFSDKTGKFALQFSHWPELIYEPFYFGKEAEFKDKYVRMAGRYHHSLQVISKELYKYYWFDHELPKDQVWGRTDNFFSDIFDEDVEIFVALKEFCRHFDGYQHSALTYPNNVVPVLEIPDGFFENDIKINYNSAYKDGYTNINPKASSLKIYDKEGFDFWYSKKFIPPFWKSRISEFINDHNENEYSLDDFFLLKQLQLLNPLPNFELKKNILDAYMK
jgi:hypothetical protein